jgi:predicted O-methyltransferase YrrM
MQKIIEKLIQIGSKSNEGALFNNPNPQGIEEQTKFIKSFIQKYKPKTIVEIGTNKAFFVLFVVSTLEDMGLIANIHTFDAADFSELCVNEVKNNFTKHNITFYYGDSKQTFSSFDVNNQVDLTFIDGGHDYKSAASDIANAIRINSSFILLDDYNPDCTWCELKIAVDDSLLFKLYELVESTDKIDDRGMGLFKKK